MPRLRILHVTPYYERAWAYGGIPRVATSVARGLARRGHDVTVCATDACAPASRVPLSAAGVSAGVRVHLFPNLSNRIAYHQQFFVPLGFERWMREHARDFDVAHLHGCHNLPGAIAARHVRRAGVPYVLSPHGTAPRLERRVLAKWVFDHTLGRGVLEGAARVTAVTEAERRQLAALGVSAARVRVVPNPVDLAEFEEPLPRGLFRARAGLGTRPVVLFLGKLTRRKRVEALVDAFASLHDPALSLVIAGNDLGAGRAIRSRVARARVGGQTLFTGLLTGRARLEALTDADVLVHPARDEIFGLVAVEALLCGTPVVVADDSGCGEVLARTGGGRIVPQDDAPALAAAIRGTLDDSPAARSAALRAQSQIRDAYAPDTICALLEELYSEILRG